MIGRHVTRRSKRAHRAWQRPVGAVTAAVLALGGVVVTETAVAPPADAASAPLWSVDFENLDPGIVSGNPYPWWRSGNPTLAVISDPDNDSNKVLSITRTNDYDGVQSPTRDTDVDLKPFVPGTTYNFSMRARLGAEVGGEPYIYFVVKSARQAEAPSGDTSETTEEEQPPDPAPTGDPEPAAEPAEAGEPATEGEQTSPDSAASSEDTYDWVGTAKVTNSAWTTIAGTWIAPQDADTAVIHAYIGSENASGPYEVLVDDILVTERPEAEFDVIDRDGAFVPGDRVTLSGTNFPPGKSIQFTFEQEGSDLSEYVQTISPTDALGWFTDQQITLPANVAPGRPLTVIATSDGVSKSVEIDLAAAAISATPGSVARKEPITVTGTGFLANSYVQIGAPRTATVTARADDEGAIVATLTAPAFATASLEITATGTGAVPITATATIAVTGTDSDEPMIDVVDAAGVAPGGVTIVIGEHFTPNHPVTITVNYANGYFAPVTVQVGSTGSFEYTSLTIPNYWAPGNATVTAVQNSTGDQAESPLTIASGSVELSDATAGGTVTVTGQGFIVNEMVQLWTATTSWQVKTDAKGAFVTSAPVPHDATTVKVTANQWGRETSAQANVIESTEPRLIASPDTVYAGGGVTVSGVNFTNGAVVSIGIGASQNDMQTQATSGGKIDGVSISIPKGTRLGSLTIYAKVAGNPAATTTVQVVPEPSPDLSTLTAPSSVTSGEPFQLGGTHFTPNTEVKLEYWRRCGAESPVLIGGDSKTTDTIGRLTHSTAMPYIGGDTCQVLIRAVGFAAKDAIVTVTPGAGPGDIEFEDVDKAFNPGDRVNVSWEGLVPGHVYITMTANGSDVVGEGYLVVDSDGTGSGSIAIGVDTLRGTAEYTVTVRAFQGSVEKSSSIAVQNDFKEYNDAYKTAQGLIARRDRGDFQGVSGSWGELDSLVASNEFSSIGAANATQGNADRAADSLSTAIQGIAESLLEATIASGNRALDSYASAAESNPTMAEAIAGSLRAVIESLVADSTASLIPVPAQPQPIERHIAAYDFEGLGTNEQPGIPRGVWTQVAVVDDPRPDSNGSVLKTDRVNDWEGLELPADQFSAGDVCTFQAEVGNPESSTVDPLDIRFLAMYYAPNAKGGITAHYTWIGNQNVSKGDWGEINSTWTIPEGGVAFIRLVAGSEKNLGDNVDADGKPKDSAYLPFYADNVKVSCTGDANDEPDQRTEHTKLLSLEASLRAAIEQLNNALKLFAAGQAPWAPAPGSELGWAEGYGEYTDTGVARWIGRNLYIRGNSSELEGRTVVGNDLLLDKFEVYQGGWTGFNFGTVSIGSQITLGGDDPALLVCDNLEVASGSAAAVRGGSLGIQKTWNGNVTTDSWSTTAHEYCAKYASMAEKMAGVSAALAARSVSGDEDCDCGPDGGAGGANTAKVDGDTLLLRATSPDADGLYVFDVQASDLNSATKIVIEGLQVNQSSRATGGRIDSMKPAVINVRGDGAINWTVESIYLRDAAGDNQMYVGDKFWHPDLGKVAGALMWNFPDVSDARAQDVPANGDTGINALVDRKTLYGGIVPGVTIRTSGLGVNFLGSILVPNASLRTESISLNGRLYVGGDYVMDDTLTKRDGDPLYGGGYYPHGTADLLGHAEGHNYPWWFTPDTAAPSGEITITKAVDTADATQIKDVTGDEVSSMFATGRIRCMHVEDASLRGLSPQSDRWWDASLAQDPYLLTVDATWWVKVGSDGITLTDVPYGTLCAISEDLGLFDAFVTGSNRGTPVLTNGISGRLPRGSVVGADGCACSAPEDSAIPEFVGPAGIPDGFAWMLPEIAFDGVSRQVTVTSEGPTASLLLTTESSANPTAAITNSLAPLGSAAISKTVKTNDGAELDPPPTFTFRWSTPLDGYVRVGTDVADTMPGAYLVRGTSTGTVDVTAGGSARSAEYCPASEDAVPDWWPDKGAAGWWDGDTPACQTLWFRHGAALTWTEDEEQHNIGGTWYDVQKIDYQDHRTVSIAQAGTVQTEAINTLVKTPARFSVQKAIVGTGKSLVPADTEFTISYEAWADTNGNKTIDAGDTHLNACTTANTSCENTLVIRADGTTVTSTSYRTGTLIRLSEAPAPDVADVTWGEPTFSDNTFVIAEGSETPVITVTNTAHGPASFTLSKALPADNVGTAWRIEFDLTYTVYDDDNGTVARTKVGESTEKHTLSYGVDTTGRVVTKTEAGGRALQVGDIVVISEDGFDPGFDWDKNGYTVEVRNAKGELLSKCSDRGFAEGETCGAREFRITEANINTLSVTVVNRLIGPPEMPVTGGPAAAWIAMISGLALAGLWSLTRAQLVRRRPTARGGAIR